MGLADGTLLGVRSSILATAIAILALAGLADALLRWVVRRKVRHDEAAAAASGKAPDHELLYWVDRVLAAAVRPLAVTIWLAGIYAALSIVLADVAAAFAAPAARALAWVRDIGGLGTILWLFARIARV